MMGSRINNSGSAEIIMASPQPTQTRVSQAHPLAVEPGKHAPLTTGHSGQHGAETSAAGAARLRVAARHTQLLRDFQAEQHTAPGSGAPLISPRAAVLIGSLLQEEKLTFEVMAERLSPARYAIQQFHAPAMQQLLDKFSRPGEVPGKADTAQLIKGYAHSVADQLEHFQLMHDAAAETLTASSGPGGLRDRNTLNVSQNALSEYAGRAAKAIETGLGQSIALLDSHLAQLDTTLSHVGQEEQAVLLSDKQALVEARATLVDVQAEFSKTPEAKRLNVIVAHAQLDALVEKQSVDHDSVAGWKGAGPMVAAAIPQFLSSMTHLGFIRSATNDKMQNTVPGSSSDASMLKAAVVGLVAGVAHEGVTNLVKPLLQAGLQATGLNDRLGMVPLKGIDTNSLIPDPFELKNEKGVLVRKTDQQLAADKASVEVERAVLNQIKVQVSSTHPLGEMIPYGAFGGGQAIRQLLHDFNQINGQTVTARALTSGMAGAISASTQTIAQLKATYVDPQGRKIPVFAPDRAASELGKDLAKGLDPRDPVVRTAFYSKAVSGIQSSALTGALPPVASVSAGTTGRLSAGNILRNMTLAATGSVSYLSTLYANQSVTAEAKALKEAGMGGASPMVARTETALSNIRHPDRASLPHTFQPGTLSGIPRGLESLYHVGRGALQLPTQVAVDALQVVESAALSGFSAARNALKPAPKPLDTTEVSGSSAPDDAELIAMEEGRRQ